MGLFSVTKKVGNQIFDVNISSWLGYQSIKSSTKSLINDSKTSFNVEHSALAETFEEAIARLNITEEELQTRKIEFTRLFLMFFTIAGGIFLYGLIIAITYKNLIGFFISIGLCVFAMSQAFKYHFWSYQIKARRLGCSIKDWFHSSGIN